MVSGQMKVVSEGKAGGPWWKRHLAVSFAGHSHCVDPASGAKRLMSMSFRGILIALALVLAERVSC
jgi:hypothetical protein